MTGKNDDETLDKFDEKASNVLEKGLNLLMNQPDAMRSQMPIVIKTDNPTVAVGLLIEKAIDTGADAQFMEKLYQIWTDTEERKQKKAFHVAMHELHKELTPAVKNEVATMKPKDGGDGWSYPFISFDAVAEHLDPLIEKNGFAYTFRQSPPVDGYNETVCVIMHVDGHSMESPFFAPIGDNRYISGMQNVAASNSFCKRQALLAGFGVTTKDDHENNIAREPRSQDRPGHRDRQGSGGREATATEPQVGMMKRRLDDAGISEAEFFRENNLSSFEEIYMNQVDEILEWIRKYSEGEPS